jgi:hypothetical protein
VSSRHAGGNRFGLHLGALGRCDHLEEATIRRVLQANGEGSPRPWRDDRVGERPVRRFSAGRSLKITKRALTRFCEEGWPEGSHTLPDEMRRLLPAFE